MPVPAVVARAHAAALVAGAVAGALVGASDHGAVVRLPLRTSVAWSAAAFPCETSASARAIVGTRARRAAPGRGVAAAAAAAVAAVAAFAALAPFAPFAAFVAFAVAEFADDAATTSAAARLCWRVAGLTRPALETAALGAEAVAVAGATFGARWHRTVGSEPAVRARAHARCQVACPVRSALRHPWTASAVASFALPAGVARAHVAAAAAVTRALPRARVRFAENALPELGAQARALDQSAVAGAPLLWTLAHADSGLERAVLTLEAAVAGAAAEQAEPAASAVLRARVHTAMGARPAGLAVALAVQASAMARAVTARRAAVDDQRAQADRGRGGRGEKGQPREGGHWASGRSPSARRNWPRLEAGTPPRHRASASTRRRQEQNSRWKYTVGDTYT